MPCSLAIGCIPTIMRSLQPAWANNTSIITTCTRWSICKARYCCGRDPRHSVVYLQLYFTVFRLLFVCVASRVIYHMNRYCLKIINLLLLLLLLLLWLAYCCITCRPTLLLLYVFIHYYAALLPSRGPHIASHSVCPSVCPSVPLSLPSVTSRHLTNYNDTHVLFTARAEGRISYGHLGRTNLF